MLVYVLSIRIAESENVQKNEIKHPEIEEKQKTFLCSSFFLDRIKRKQELVLG